MAAPTPPPLPARTGGYWTSTQWMVDDVSIGQYGDLTVVDLPEFQLDYESGTLTTRLRELPFFVLTPAVLSACKVTANTFCPITGKKGGPIFWCNASRGSGHALAGTARAQDGLLFAPVEHERRQDEIISWGAPWEALLDVVDSLETLLQLVLGSTEHRLRTPVLISNRVGSPSQQLHRDLCV
jgi:hypothetical protein